MTNVKIIPNVHNQFPNTSFQKIAEDAAYVGRNLFVFHHSDMDGAFAAACVEEALKLCRVQAIYVPVNYDRQDDMSIVDAVGHGDMAFVLDFAFSKRVTEALNRKTYFAFTLDHHKGNARLIEGVEQVYFDMNSSGAKMAYEFFFPGEKIPLAITLADNRDLWNKTDGREDAFHEMMMIVRSESPDYATFIQDLTSYFNDERTEEICGVGPAAIRKRNSNIHHVTRDKMLKVTSVGGYPAVFFNYGVDQSDACESIYLREEFRNCIIVSYYVKADGTVPLSIRKGPDCEADLDEVARLNFNGGGHKFAAGGLIDLTRLGKYLTDKVKRALCWDTDQAMAVVNDESKTEAEKVKALMKLPTYLVDRDACETNPELQQILPYVALSDSEWNLLGYHRPNTGDESRLHGDFSIGFGGHVDTVPERGISLENHLAAEAIRELTEETGITDDCSELRFDLLDNLETGFGVKILKVNDDVGSVHLGLGMFIILGSEFPSMMAFNDKEVIKVFSADMKSMRNYARHNPTEPWTVKMLTE